MQAMHVIAAQNVVRWARKRYDMGLGGFGYPAEDSEEAWLVMDSRSPHGWSDDTESAVRSTDDVPPAALADPDSRFVECGGLTVHYKEACVPTVRLSHVGNLRMGTFQSHVSHSICHHVFNSRLLLSM